MYSYKGIKILSVNLRENYIQYQKFILKGLGKLTSFLIAHK